MFVILGHFLPFQPPDNQKNRNFTIEKNAWRYYHFLNICTINDNLLMYGSWDVDCDRQNFLSFWTVFCPFTPLWTQKNKLWKKWKKYLKILSFYKHKWQSYDAWFLRYGMQQTEYFIILDCFSPFYPLTTQKIKILKKWKKRLEILSFYTFNINDNHMMYGSWDIECDRHNFLSFWTIFCPFTPLTTQKIKILKIWKKHLKILSFYTSVT